MAIFKKRGKWWIDYRGADGGRHREYAAPTSSLAREILAKKLNEAAEQKNFPGRVANNTTYKEIADKFLNLHVIHMKSTTWKYMVAHSVARFGPKKLGSITGGDIQQYYHDIASKTSYSTANRYHSLVRCLFNKAKSWGDFYGDNPCAKVTRQREPNHRLRFLDQGEMERLLAAADPRLRPVLVCALLTGMRRGELIRLKWEDIDLERNLIHIYQAKSGKPREIPISNKLHEEFLSLGPRKEGSAFDLPLIMLRRYYEKALRDAHIYGFRFHDLRHTFASHFIMKTCDLPALQSILGHSTPALTLRYAHLSRGHLASNMAAFEAAIPVVEQPKTIVERAINRPQIWPGNSAI